ELFVRELFAGAAQVVRFGEDALGDGNDRLSRLGDRHETLAVTHEDVDAELVLERADLLRDAGLRRVERRRRLGYVEAAARDLGEVAQLLELHITNSARDANTLGFESIKRATACSEKCDIHKYCG